MFKNSGIFQKNLPTQIFFNNNGIKMEFDPIKNEIILRIKDDLRIGGHTMAYYDFELYLYITKFLTFHKNEDIPGVTFDINNTCPPLHEFFRA